MPALSRVAQRPLGPLVSFSFFATTRMLLLGGGPRMLGGGGRHIPGTSSCVAFFLSLCDSRHPLDFPFVCGSTPRTLYDGPARSAEWKPCFLRHPRRRAQHPLHLIVRSILP